MKKLLTLLSIVAFASDASAQTQSKRELTKAVLSEFGVSMRFNASVSSGADAVGGGGIANPKLHQWLQELWVQELGWSNVEDAYIAHFESKFSESELKELLLLSKSPTVKKVFKEELDAYRATAERRGKMFETFWQRYNANEFSPPAEVTKGGQRSSPSPPQRDEPAGP